MKINKGWHTLQKKMQKVGAEISSFDLGDAGHTVNPKEVEMSYGKNKLAPSQESTGQVRSQQ